MSKSATNIMCNSINVLCKAKGLMNAQGEVTSWLISNRDGKFRVSVPAAIFNFVVPDDDVLIIMSVVKTEAIPLEVADIIPFEKK